MYEKQTWADGDVITAEKLNHIEDGVASGRVLIVKLVFDDDKQLYVMDKTFGELYDAFINGTTILEANIHEQKAQDDEQVIRYYDEQYDLVKNLDFHYSADGGDNWYGNVGSCSVLDCNTREELMNSYPYSS